MTAELRVELDKLKKYIESLEETNGRLREELEEAEDDLDASQLNCQELADLLRDRATEVYAPNHRWVGIWLTEVELKDLANGVIPR